MQRLLCSTLVTIQLGLHCVVATADVAVGQALKPRHADSAGIGELPNCLSSIGMLDVLKACIYSPVIGVECRKPSRVVC